MCLFKWTFPLLLLSAAPLHAGPVEAATEDLRTVPPALRRSVRYLSLAGIKERDDAVKVISGHCNGLSTESDITKVVVAGDILRINLQDYAWSASTWDLLGDTDPYFHVQIQTEFLELWPGGVWRDGISYAAGSFTTKKVRVDASLAPWVAGPAMDYLVKETQSKAPILRADWFFNRTAAQQDRRPGYYDFLGIKTEADFQRIIGFDAKKPRRKVELREAVNESGVTLQPRAIVREAAEDGGYWKTLDFRKSLDKANTLRVLNGDIDKAFKEANATDVASEQYGHLANGFWATCLTDNAGVLQATAPDFIAADHFSKSNDRRIHVNVGCIRCHSNGGLQPIDGWARNLFQPPLILQSPDYAVARRLKQQYLRDLEPFIDRDRALFAAAVKEATGWDVKNYAAKYAAFWERYEDARVDVNWAAADWNMTPQEFTKRLQDYAMRTGAIDPVVSVFLSKGPRATLSIKTYEELQPVLYLVLKGVQQP